MDIAAWLQGLGLERYVPAFRDNEIDWEVLPKLTSELRRLGAERGDGVQQLAPVADSVPHAIWPEMSLQGRRQRVGGGAANGRNRRVSPVTLCPDEFRLIQPIAGA